MVADASAVVEFLLGGPRGRAVESLFLQAQPLQAPSLIDAEVVQALRRLLRLGIIDEARAGAAVELLQEMPLTRHHLGPLLPRIWGLRENLTAYDAAYVVLAEALDCPVVTYDEGMAAAPGHGARVLVPGTGSP